MFDLCVINMSISDFYKKEKNMSISEIMVLLIGHIHSKRYSRLLVDMYFIVKEQT